MHLQSNSQTQGSECVAEEGRKDYKIQRIREFTVRLCLIEMSEVIHKVSPA